jgi:uncharacterized protein (TIGR02466 family)
MRLNYNYLWPLPVVTDQFHRKLTEEEYNFIVFSTFEQKQSNEISKNVHVLNCPELSELKKDLDQYLQQYWNDIYDCEQSIRITNSWIAKSKAGEKHHTHEHPNSIVSGVLYIKAEEGTGDFNLIHSGPIYDRMEFNYDLRRFSPINSRNWMFPVKTGDIIIFPSSCLHGTSVNNSERIILGFNSFVEGNFGGNYISDLNLRIV